MVLVDTPIWSLALRRNANFENDAPIRVALAELIQRDEAKLAGVVRQELLSGVRDRSQFAKLRDHLRRFPDIPLTAEDYEAAAEASNRLRSSGIASSPADAFLCALGISRNWSVFTTDGDFVRYAAVLPLKIYGDR